jgi:hypothetical protein
MAFFRFVSDWLVVRVFWLSLLASTAQADVILWEQAPLGPGGSGGLSQIAAGQIRSTSIDLVEASILQGLQLNLGSGFMSAPAQISLWIDSTPGQRQRLVYTGGFRNTWSGLSQYLPRGRSWLSVETLSGGPIVWASPVGLSGGALTTTTGTVSTDAYAGRAIGVAVPVPEPEFVVLLACCCAAGVFYAWKGRGR